MEKKTRYSMRISNNNNMKIKYKIKHFFLKIFISKRLIKTKIVKRDTFLLFF